MVCSPAGVILLRTRNQHCPINSMPILVLMVGNYSNIDNPLYTDNSLSIEIRYSLTVTVRCPIHSESVLIMAATGTGRVYQKFVSCAFLVRSCKIFPKG